MHHLQFKCPVLKATHTKLKDPYPWDLGQILSFNGTEKFLCILYACGLHFNKGQTLARAMPLLESQLSTVKLSKPMMYVLEDDWFWKAN